MGRKLESDDWKKIVVGVIVLALAGVFIAAKSSHAGCELGAAGLESIAEGVSHGQDTEEIRQATDLVPLACEALVNSVISNPSERVTFNLKLPSGGVTEENVTGSSISSPPPPTPSESTQRLFDCLGWHSSLLYDACVNGTLPPTPG